MEKPEGFSEEEWKEICKEIDGIIANATEKLEQIVTDLDFEYPNRRLGEKFVKDLNDMIEGTDDD